MSGLRCGLCTGGVRLFRGSRYGRPITDWKHTDVPPGTQPHRPVLGRPVDEQTLQRLHRNAGETAAKTVKEYGVPLVAPRPATDGETPGSAKKMRELGLEYGWEVMGRVTYYQTALGDEVVVLRLRRGDLGAVAVWEARGKAHKWTFTEGYTRCGPRTEQVGSEQLKAWLKARDERCPDCGRSSAAHHEGDCP